MVGGDGVLPGRAARRLRLRACAHQVRAGTPLGHHPSRGDGDRVLLAAAVDRVRLGPSARDRRGVLAARPVHGLDRPAVLRAVGQCAAVAGMVRAHRPSVGARSLFPLCRQQYRQLPGADGLSDGDRAVHPARAADLSLGRRLRAADAADRGLRLSVAAVAGTGAVRRTGRRFPTTAPARRRRRPGRTSGCGSSSRRCRRGFWSR